MEEKVILAALEEIQIHALRFRMADVTGRLHMSKTSLYKIVDSKDSLIREIMTYLMVNFDKEEQKIRAMRGPVRDKVTAFIRLYTEAFKKFDKSIYADLRRDYETEWNRWAGFREKKISVFMEILQEGIDKGEFRTVNLDVMRQCLMVTSAALSEFDFLKNSNLTYSMALESLGDILFVGIERK
jgi:AcrR family transcriptional regulator